MSTVKRITDLTDYTNVLPYASELFGVYQPLLGWKSKRLEKRFNKGFKNEKFLLLEKLKNQFSDMVNIEFNERNELKINIKPGVLKTGDIKGSESLVLENISSRLPEFKAYKPSIWSDIINEASIESILTIDIVEFYSKLYANRPSEYSRNKKTINTDPVAISVLKKQLQYESLIAGALLYLVKEQSHSILEELFYKSTNKVDQAEELISMIKTNNSSEAFLDIENLDPTEKEQLKGVSLSPISVVHLFRQYFFELDTFLGTPESHVWLSPGSSATLIEEHTRRNVVEKTIENSFDILTRSETEKSVKDEISDAVKDENSKTLNLGASVTASYTNISATASFDYESSQNNAREKTHKSMREQTQKLSSEIRKNFKSTFKTVTEVTDFSSVEHVLSNTTAQLINYELRRKMRQVGVQVQDIGTYLCWQTFVDDPGKDLGLSKLIHIAQSAELDRLQHPEEIPRLQTSKEVRSVTIPFIATNPEGADKDEVYVDGEESDGNNEGWGSGNFETIQADFPLKFISPKENHELKQVEFDSLGKPVSVSIVENTLVSNNGQASLTLHLDTANFEGNSSIQINLTLHWEPNEAANIVIDAKNNANTQNFKAEEKTAYESAYLETVKDRVNAVSNITSRDKEELREEERIVIYRKLIQDMLLNKVSQPDDKTRHVLAELINSIFDVDKMLYFVAPEWWRPRLHQSKQQLHERPARSRPKKNTAANVATKRLSFAHMYTANFMNTMVNATPPEKDPANVDPNIMASNTAGWGDIDDETRDNYYITEDSTPAKFGSSLGWLMQLDGDNRRNAFLNSPWVKAVMPIRPGKEKAAINWLKAVEGMNGITDDVLYHSNNPDEKDINGQPLNGQKMIDVLMDLANKVDKKHKESLEKDTYPKAGDVSDPALVDQENTVTSTPIDRVYEHGFFPLENSFRANIGKNYEIFDQWIEILPTDQTVPVEVEYDPITGRQI